MFIESSILKEPEDIKKNYGLTKDQNLVKEIQTE